MNRIFTFLLMLSIPIFFTGCKKLFLEQPPGDPEAIFEDLWTTFDEAYAPFEERNVDWEAQYETYRPMVNPGTTDDELFDVFSQMLATLDDGHVSLTAPGRNVFFSNRIRQYRIDDELFDLSVIKDWYLENGYRQDEQESFIYGKMNGRDIGYIFFDYVGPNFAALNDFLEEYGDMNSFIIDLRHNKGGDFTYCFSEMGRLTAEKRYVFRSRTKNGEGRNEYTDWHEWYIEPAGEFIDKPIMVLTDRYTISAGERSVMAMMTLPNVTLVGDTTNGAHGTMIGRELANGWYYSLVPQKVELFDGHSYEGIGLAPDICVKNLPDELSRGTDRVLETAVEKLH
jgi:carboxyl-terminal processing protease